MRADHAVGAMHRPRPVLRREGSAVLAPKKLVVYMRAHAAAGDIGQTSADLEKQKTAAAEKLDQVIAALSYDWNESESK